MGRPTVEKIVRMTEVALRDELPIFWFIDSAGARITDQVDLFRAGGGRRIFRNQVALSGKVPQICCLFGRVRPAAAYIPAFCDLVIMVEANASMYSARPDGRDGGRGEGDAGGDRRCRMHRGLRLGDQLAADDAEAIEQAKQYFSTCHRTGVPPPPSSGGGPTRRRSSAQTFRPKERATTSRR